MSQAKVEQLKSAIRELTGTITQKSPNRTPAEARRVVDQAVRKFVQNQLEEAAKEKRQQGTSVSDNTFSGWGGQPW